MGIDTVCSSKSINFEVQRVLYRLLTSENTNTISNAIDQNACEAIASNQTAEAWTLVQKCETDDYSTYSLFVEKGVQANMTVANCIEELVLKSFEAPLAPIVGIIALLCIAGGILFFSCATLIKKTLNQPSPERKSLLASNDKTQVEVDNIYTL